MFSETLLTFPSLANFSPSNALSRLLLHALIILALGLFLYAKTLFTSVFLIGAIFHHHFLLKLNLARRTDVAATLASQTDFRLPLKRPERPFLIFLFLFVLFTFTIKTFLYLGLNVYKTPAFSQALTSLHLDMISGFVSTVRTDLTPDLLTGLGLVLFVTTLLVTSFTQTMYFDRPTLKILRRVLNPTAVDVLYVGVSLMMLIRVLWHEGWSTFGFIESQVIVIIMIFCFTKYRMSGNFQVERFLNYHKYFCAFKLVLLAVHCILEHLPVKYFWVVKVIRFFPEIEIIGRPWSPHLLLIMALYLGHAWLNFSLKFRRKFCPRPLAFHPRLRDKPYSLQLISYFAKNLLTILNLPDPKKALTVNNGLAYRFYNDLAQHFYFKRQFEYSLRAFASGQVPSLKLRLATILMKVQFAVKAYRYELLRHLLDAFMVVYFSYLFGQMNILSLFYLLASLVILIYSRFQTITYAVFIFGIAPSFIIILLLSAYNLAKEWEYNTNFAFLNDLILKCGFDFDPESIKQFLHKQTNFIGLASLYLILVSYINSRTRNRQGLSLVQFLRSKRLIVLSTDEDLLFLARRLVYFLCLLLKYFLLFAILVEFLHFVNLLNTLLLLFLVFYLLIPRPAVYDLFCEAALFVFVLRFFYRYAHRIFASNGRYSFIFGYFFHDTLSLGAKDLEHVLRHQEWMLIKAFYLICILFALRKVFRFLGGGFERRAFKTARLSRIYSYVMDVARDSEQFVHSMKIFVLYFYTFKVPNTDTIPGFAHLPLFEYGLTVAVLLCHLVAIRRPGTIKNYVFFCMFLLYCVYLMLQFGLDYRMVFTSNYRKTEGEVFDARPADITQNSSQILGPAIFKLLLALISLKDVWGSLSGKSLSSKSIAFRQITKDKFYFGVLKFLSVFFKEVFLLALLRDFLVPPNLTKMIFLCFYLFYFNSQFRCLLQIADEFQMTRLLALKIHYYGRFLLSPRRQSPPDPLDLHDPLFQDAEIAYYKLFTRRTYNAFYKKVGKVWVLTFFLLLSYMSMLFMIKTHQSVRETQAVDFTTVRMLVGFWESSETVGLEYDKILVIFGITVLEIFFINMLKSNWDEENEGTAKVVTPLLIGRYLRLFSDNPELAAMTGVDKAVLTHFDHLFHFFKAKDFSLCNYQVEKYRSSQDRSVVDNIKRGLDSRQRFMLLRLNRSKLALLQILGAAVAVFKRVILFPFLVGLMMEESSIFSFVGIAVVYLCLSSPSLKDTLRILNFSITLLWLLDYSIFFLMFENLGVGTDSSVDPILRIILHFHNRSFSGMWVYLQYIITTKIFFTALIGVTLQAFVKIDKIPVTFWQRVRTKTIGRDTYSVLDYSDWNWGGMELLYQIKKLAVGHLADVFYLVTLASYYMVWGGLASIIFMLFVAMKFTVIFKWNRAFTDSVVVDCLRPYRGFSVLTIVVILYIHFEPDTVALFKTQNLYMFPLTLVFNLILLDCIHSYDFQSERDRIGNYDRLRLRLASLNRVYHRNENGLVACAKEEMLNEYLQKKTEAFLAPKGREDTNARSRFTFNQATSQQTPTRLKVPSGFSGTAAGNTSTKVHFPGIGTSTFPEAPDYSAPKSGPLTRGPTLDCRGQSNHAPFSHFGVTEDLISLSLFSRSKQYSHYLKEKIGWIKHAKVSIMFWIRKTVVRQNSVSGNLFAMIGGFIAKNSCFIPRNYSLDICGILGCDFQDVERILAVAETQRKSMFERDKLNLVAIVDSKVEGCTERENRALTKFTLRGQSSPHAPLIASNAVHDLNRELLKRLTRSGLEEQFLSCPPDQFGKNFFKLRLGDDQFLILRNFDRIDQSFRELNRVGLSSRDNLKQIVMAVATRLEILAALCLALLFCFDQGIMAGVYLGLLTFGIVMENRPKNIRIWRLFYIIFQANFLVTMALNNQYDLLPFDRTMNVVVEPTLPPPIVGKALLFLYGKVNGAYLLFLFVLVELVFLSLNHEDTWDKCDDEVENKPQAIHRLALTDNGFLELFQRENQILISHYNALEHHLKQSLKAQLPEQEYTRELIDLSKRKTAIYRLNRDKYANFLTYISRLNRSFKIDEVALRAANNRSYFWRNFSFTQKKLPRNYHAWMSLLLGVVPVYFVCFYFQLTGSDHLLGEILKNNEIHATLGINITIMFLALCFERYVYSSKPFFWIEPSEDHLAVLRRHLRNLEVDSPDFRAYTKTPIELFRKCVRRITAVIRLKKPACDSPVCGYRNNPMFTRFIFTALFFVYINVLVFVVIPIVSNDLITERIWDSLFCNGYYRTRDDGQQVRFECNTIATNRYLQVLFLLSNLYVLLSAYQIKVGFSSRFYFKPTSFDNWRRRAGFYLYKFPPFFRELKTIIDFACARTALNLMQWFRIEDIQTSLTTARLNRRSVKFDGQRLDKTLKRVSGLAVLAFFVALLLGPLYIFSDFLFSTRMDEVTSATLLLHVKSRHISYPLYRNFGFKVEKLAKKHHIFRKLDRTDTERFETDAFQTLFFGSNFHSEMSLTNETASAMKDDFQRSGQIEFNLDLTLRTQFRGTLVVTFPFKLEAEAAEEFLSYILGQQCENKASARLNLGSSPKLINIRPLDENARVTISSNDHRKLENYYVLILRCDPVTNKIEFELSEEFNERFEFVILNKSIKSSVSLLQSFTDHKISLFYVYLIIFGYIGMDFIRNALFAQAHSIWTTALPESYPLEEIIYLILFARVKGDTMAENYIFNRLCDYYRSPEKIKKLTGTYLNLANLGKSVAKFSARSGSTYSK